MKTIAAFHRHALIVAWVAMIGSLAVAHATKPETTTGGRDAELTAAARDGELVKVGKDVYAGLCKSCHGDESVQGDSPSNLFDTKWHHGAKPTEIEAIVVRGILEKGMPGWGEVLPAEDVTAVIAYLLSVQPAASRGSE